MKSERAALTAQPSSSGVVDDVDDAIAAAAAAPSEAALKRMETDRLLEIEALAAKNAAREAAAREALREKRRLEEELAREAERKKELRQAKADFLRAAAEQAIRDERRERLRAKARKTAWQKSDDGGVAAIHATFRSFDWNGSGTIDRKELKEALEGLGMPGDGPRVRHFLTKYDTDKSRTLDCGEFTSMVQDLHADEAAAKADARLAQLAKRVVEMGHALEDKELAALREAAAAAAATAAAAEVAPPSDADASIERQSTPTRKRRPHSALPSPPMRQPSRGVRLRSAPPGGRRATERALNASYGAAASRASS